MKTKKLLSLLLCFVMLCSMFTPVAFASDTEITVYVTLSKYGEILSLESGQYLACVPVVLEEENPNLDTVFREFHSLYHPKGEEAYSSYEGEYGTAIDMLWEDTSELFGYQVNGGAESVYGLSHTVQDGDYVDVCIYQSEYPGTESYTVFDKYTLEEICGATITLNLSVAGYDENWNTVFSPYADAEITVNGEATGAFTDENGDAAITLYEEGTYIISAASKKTVDDAPVTAICAPVCVAEISRDKGEEILHNLASKYCADEIMSDGNAYWFAANIADYGKIYPESEFFLSEEIKQSVADSVIDMCANSQKPGDLAKGIIALRSMGYDARNTYTEEGKVFDIVAKLTSLAENDFEQVAKVYTLPYVIIALGSGEGYAQDETLNQLITYAAENNGDWLHTEFGTDALTPMILALSPYTASSDSIRNAVENGTEILLASVNEEGMIGNTPSTALAIVALCAMGIDPQTVESNGNNLIDGLLSQINETQDGFIPAENSFATEQAMRALNAYMLFKSGDRVFNFIDFPMEEIHHTIRPKAKVVFETEPKSARVTVEGNEAEDNIFHLAAGTYSYKVSKSDYKTKQDEFTISEEDAENSETITIKVSLTRKSSGGGSSGISVNPQTEKSEDATGYEGNAGEAVTFPDIAESPYKAAIEELAGKGIISGTDQGLFLPENTVTRAEFAVMITKALALTSDTENPFCDVNERDWFFSYVNAAFQNNIVSGISATEFNPYGIITKEEAAAMTARATGVCGIDTALSEAQTKNILCQFADYTEISSWASQNVAFCYETGILDVSEMNSTPKKALSRGEIAQMLRNMLKTAKRI